MSLGTKIARLIADQTGATAIEYGLIAGLIFLAIVSAVTLFAGDVSDMFNTVSNTVTNNV